MDLRDTLDYCFSAPFKDVARRFTYVYRENQRRFQNTMHFYAPGMIHYETEFYTTSGVSRFPGISVTGQTCHLQCEHCNGILLKNMIPVATPQQLYDTCVALKNAGGEGCLISGGSVHRGHVPLKRFLPAIRQVKQDIDFQVVVHTGIPTKDIVTGLANANIDAAMFDVIGSDETLRTIYHLNRGTDIFDEGLRMLEENSIPAVPHIIVGLHYGSLKGEAKAIEIIAKHSRKAVVIAAFMPLETTPMSHVQPSPPEDIARVIFAARVTLPNTRLLLGCARPRGPHKSQTDILAIQAGINGIAYPSTEAYSLVEQLGLKIRFHNTCCSLLWKDTPSSDPP